MNHLCAILLPSLLTTVGIHANFPITFDGILDDRSSEKQTLAQSADECLKISREHAASAVAYNELLAFCKPLYVYGGLKKSFYNGFYKERNDYDADDPYWKTMVYMHPAVMKELGKPVIFWTLRVNSNGVNLGTMGALMDLGKQAMEEWCAYNDRKSFHPMITIRKDLERRVFTYCRVIEVSQIYRQPLAVSLNIHSQYFDFNFISDFSIVFWVRSFKPANQQVIIGSSPHNATRLMFGPSVRSDQLTLMNGPHAATTTICKVGLQRWRFLTVTYNSARNDVNFFLDVKEWKVVKKIPPHYKFVPNTHMSILQSHYDKATENMITEGRLANFMIFPRVLPKEDMLEIMKGYNQ